MSSALDRNPGYPPGCRLSDIDPPGFDAALERELRAHMNHCRPRRPASHPRATVGVGNPAIPLADNPTSGSPF